MTKLPLKEKYKYKLWVWGYFGFFYGSFCFCFCYEIENSFLMTMRVLVNSFPIGGNINQHMLSDNNLTIYFKYLKCA